MASSRSSCSAAAAARWSMFAIILRVCGSDADIPAGRADLSLWLAAPPGISIVIVPPRVCPDPITKENYPSVLAADSSGLLLLHASQGERSGPITYGDYGTQGFSWRKFVDGYFVCDTRSCVVYHLPGPQLNRILNAGNVGFVTQDGGHKYMVAELQLVAGSDQATLLCYSSLTGQWVNKIVDCPFREARPWASHGVISQLGQDGQRLWWTDVSWGLLTCLPFDDEPDLQFVPLPAYKKLPFLCGEKDLQMHRCFGVSDGELRFVEIGIPTKPSVIIDRVKKSVRRHGHRKVPWVALHTCYQESGSWSWRLEREISFEDIWSHPTYRAHSLPKKVPKLACVDPCNSKVIYFFLDNYSFGVNLCSASIDKCAQYTLECPPCELMSSRFVIACKIPASASPLV